jgi:hypothetical protein
MALPPSLTAAGPDDGPAATKRAAGTVFGACACAVVGAFVLALAWHRLDSLDLGYHLAYGRHFLEHGRIVDRDPFLYPGHARDFVNANWGAQAVFALAERMGGAAGLTALRLGLVAVIFGCGAAVVRACVPGPAWMAGAWLLASSAGYERMSLRPELMSYAAMSAALVVLARGVRRRRDVALLAGLQVLWVNLHSYFLIGPILTGAWLCGAIVDRLRRRAAPVRLLAAALGLQLAACTVNPWHVHGAVFPLATLSYLRAHAVMGGGPGGTPDSAWSLISEFHSPFAYLGELTNSRTLHSYLVLLAVAAAGAIAGLARGRLGEALAIAALAVMSFQMRRNIAPFAFAAGPLAVGCLGRCLRGPGRRRIAGTALSAASMALAGWWTVGIVDGRFYYAERRITRQFGRGYCDRTFPEAAARWLAGRSDLRPNLFVDYFTSSNTLPWLAGRFPLFVDTNTFACPPEVLGEAFDIGLGRVDHGELFRRREVNVVLLHCGPDTQELVRRLAADFTEWALVHLDRHCVVFVRRRVEHIPVILSEERRPEHLDTQAWIAAVEEPPAMKAMSLAVSAGVPMSLGWWGKAAELLEEAVRLAPDYHEAWTYLASCRANLGNAAARAGRMDEARRQYQSAQSGAERALAARPGHGEAERIRHDMGQVLKLLETR